MISAGALFKKTREGKNLSLANVHRDIRIRTHLLDAIENEQWHVFSSKMYAEGIIKTYAHYLGLPSEKMLAFFHRDYEKKEDISFKRRVRSSSLNPESRHISRIAIVLLLALFIGYFGYLLYGYIKPPKVLITAPTQTVFRNVERLTIEGKTEKEATVSILGEKIFPDKEGRFSHEFPLQKGQNIVVIEVIGGNGKKTVVTKVFTLE